ncbi:PKD domain-containing protein [Hymenobacter sp. UV11]|uniref:PKD domain-containing protein n=1 Tax=Hymenobacter sp. UV11 TaxID=1849735 RepID=UPI00106123DB|nr:PKD domain-containing protein [Hymenobacter sp. UV11]TFZ64200.1 PKD domain-containing protein [Hymenobacter sp. UV11]
MFISPPLTRWLVFLVACFANLTPTYSQSQDPNARDKAVAQPPSGKGLGTAVVGGIPVNLFTGTASPAYPLCELPGRSLTIPISLNYVAGNGVQVASVASEVGTGWALTAGGSVTCEVRGRPDEFDTESKSWLTSLINHTGGTELASKICEGKDTEYDVYHLVAPGLQADFVIRDPASSPSQGEVYVLNDRTLTITPTYWSAPATSRRIFSFLVIDAQGTRYTFDQKEDTRVQTETKNLRTGNLSNKDDYTYTAKWYLTKLQDATGDQISFSYQGYNATPVSYKSYAHVTHAYYKCNAWDQNCQTATPYPNSYLDTRYETTTTIRPTLGYSISHIFSATGYVRFFRDTHNRLDVPGEKALDKIAVYDKNDRVIKSILLTYGYFGPWRNITPDEVRLRLDRITVKSSGCQATSTDLFYRGMYGGTVSRQATNRDYWGYFNDNSSGELLPFVESRYASGDRTPSTGLTAQNCILYKIQYGTGAYTELTYGRQIDGVGATIGGVRVEQIRVHNGISTAQNQLFTLNYNTFFPNSGTFASTSSAPPVPIPKLYEWQNVRFSTVYPGQSYYYGADLNICDSQDDLTDKFLYRSSDAIAPIPLDYMHYQWVTIQHPNSSRTAYQFTTTQNYPDTYNTESVKITSDPYNTNSGCYTSAGALPLKYGGSCNGDPMAPHRAGDYLSLPQDQRPYGIMNSATAKRGLVLQQVEVDAAGRLISQTTNEYDFLQSDATPLKSVVVDKERRVFGFIMYSYYYNAKVYKHERNWIPLIRQTALRYDQRRGNSGTISSQTQITEYAYKNYFVSKVKSYNVAGGDAQVVEYQRGKDAGAPAVLVNAQSYASVFQKEEYRLDAAGNKKGSLYSLYEYQPNANNYVWPLRTGTWDTSSGVNQWQYRVLAVEFDDYGNTVNSQSSSGLWSGTLLGANKLLPIATVANGKFGNGSVVATAGHTSLEEDGDPDQWSSGTIYTAEAKTGLRSVQLSNSSNTYGPGKTFTLEPKDQHGKYFFSCWAKVPQGQAGQSNVTMVTYVGVSSGNNSWRGTTQTVSSGQAWQFCRGIVDLDDPTIRTTLPSNQNITIQCYPWISSGSGNVLVDEFRFHAENARMATATHQLHVGKTSTTDENNVTTYYVYDSESQPLLTKDALGNILKRTKTNSTATTQEILATVAQTGGNAYPNTDATFTAAAPDCASNINYTWNFGDGSTAKGSGSQTHAYAQLGTYPLTVVAEAPGFNPVEKTLSVQVVSPLGVYATYYGSTYMDLCDPYGSEYGGGGQRDASITVQPQQGCGTYTYRWETNEYTSWSNSWGGWVDANNYSPTFSYYHGSPRQLQVRCTVTDACGNSVVYQDQFYTYASSPQCATVIY